MKIQNIQNSNNRMTFGTYLGINMQEKVLLAKQRGLFSKEQLANLEKIEGDALDAVLEISKKYVIHSVNNKKGILETRWHLTLHNGPEKTNIVSADSIYRPTNSNNNIIFLPHKFVKLFDNDFSLAEKVKAAWNSLADNVR